MNRFEKQIQLKGFGEQAQNKLKNASVLLIGAGGLGCPVLLYLAAAGVGTIGIADGDHISLSNLNRQVLYGEQDLDKLKASVAAEHFHNKYCNISINVIPEYISTSNAIKYISQYDIIVDCTDNFSARYIINDACVLLDKPLVFGAIYQYEGHMAVFNIPGKRGKKLHYRDLFPVIPSVKDAPDCNATGVIGVLPGVIGTLMASEVIKLLSGYTTAYADKVLWYNMKSNSFYETGLTHNLTAEITTPTSIEEFEKNDYSVTCNYCSMIEWNLALDKVYYPSENVLFVDVRNEHEQPIVSWVEHINIPITKIENLLHQNNLPDTIFFFCQSGFRSKKAIEIIKDALHEKRLYSISGGVNSYTATNIRS